MKRKTDSPKKNGLLLSLLILGVILISGGLLLYVFRTQLLTGVANLLIVDDRLQPADMIFVLNGDVNTRPFRASELYQQRLAPLIGIARSENSSAGALGLMPNETDLAVGVMKKLGVPPEKIVVLPAGEGVTSTYDEAVILRQYTESHDIHSVILVTSAFHTRRVKWIFERELYGLSVTLEVAAVPYSGFDETNWWQSEQGLIALNNEYIKLIYYYWKYR